MIKTLAICRLFLLLCCISSASPLWAAETALPQVQKGAFATRAAFDAMDAIYRTDREEADSVPAVSPWADPYVMEAYVVMYEATQDEEYLRRLVRHADEVLAQRDSENAVQDYRGRVLPGWTVGAPYGIGEIELRDAQGRPTLFLGTAIYSYNHETRITVRAGEKPDTFDLAIENKRHNVAGKFTGLTMNQGADNYAVKVLGASKLADPFGEVRLKVRALEAGAGNPVVGESSLQTPRYLWAVHQGQFLYPLAAFARVVETTPHLRAQPRWKTKADQYVAVAEEVFATLEDEWRQNERGEGWYLVHRSAPVWFDGVDVPINQFLAVGRAMVELVGAGRGQWRGHVTRMAQLFKNDLVVQKNGTVLWGYWWSKGHAARGWKPSQNLSLNTPGYGRQAVAEDLSHGSIDIVFAWLCYRNQIVFTRADMERFAQTFLRNVVKRQPDGTPTLRQRIDGRGTLGKTDTIAVGWIRLAQIEPPIATVFTQIYRDVEWSKRVINLLASANLNYVATAQPIKRGP